MKKQDIKRITAIALLAAILAGTMISCKSDVNMTRRRKSRCNTCPTFSYTTPNTQNDAQTCDLARL
ncbi:MAG: hypothetical protein IJQ89_10850 [Bacteroidales bacterium]|nr:hypothetical protein [Bacteroidales bacterium]